MIRVTETRNLITDNADCAASARQKGQIYIVRSSREKVIVPEGSTRFRVIDPASDF
jgi:hypothetical protein